MPVPSRWDPFRDVRRFDPFAGLEDVFRAGLLREPGPRALAREEEYEREPEMRTDVTEDEQTYYAQVEIPGVRKSDIDVAVEGARVTITVETGREPLRSGEEALYTERYVGKTGRIFALPEEIDSERSTAVYEDGLLSLTLPKKREGTSRRLSIRRRVPWRHA